MGNQERVAAYEARQAELAKLNDDELKARFWELANELMTPVIELARTHTSPSIERSVLMRMGIDSVSTHPVVDAVHDRGLLGKGAGHVVLKLAHQRGIAVKAAAQLIIDDPAVLHGLFEGK